ncbi:MAG: hypothetical protein JXB49_08780 [Bacteroidales bacterium]|nr:hypothetical protein [Bacteroidales bacterium]
MKIAGIILIVVGALSVLGALMAASQGHEASFAGLVFVILGAFLISRANRKKTEEDNKKQWESGEVKNE